MFTKYKIVPFCPYHFVHTILSNTILSVYHFVHTILSVPFCPRTIPGAERVESLGVLVTSHLIMRVPLDQIISSSASSIFALRKLRSHGLQPSQLHLVARTTTVASLLYASPAWWGFTSAESPV